MPCHPVVALAVLMSCGRCDRLEEELDGECREPGSYELPPCKWCICTEKMEEKIGNTRDHPLGQLADYEVGMLDSYLQ